MVAAVVVVVVAAAEEEEVEGEVVAGEEVAAPAGVLVEAARGVAGECRRPTGLRRAARANSLEQGRARVRPRGKAVWSRARRPAANGSAKAWRAASPGRS